MIKKLIALLCCVGMAYGGSKLLNENQTLAITQDGEECNNSGSWGPPYVQCPDGQSINGACLEACRKTFDTAMNNAWNKFCRERKRQQALLDQRLITCESIYNTCLSIGQTPAYCAAEKNICVTYAQQQYDTAVANAIAVKDAEADVAEQAYINCVLHCCEDDDSNAAFLPTKSIKEKDCNDFLSHPVSIPSVPPCFEPRIRDEECLAQCKDDYVWTVRAALRDYCEAHKPLEKRFNERYAECWAMYAQCVTSSPALEPFCAAERQACVSAAFKEYYSADKELKKARTEAMQDAFNNLMSCADNCCVTPEGD